MKNKIILLLLIFISAILFSCSTEPEPVKKKDTDKKKLIVADITKVVDLETRNKISAIDTNNFTFTLNGETEVIKNLKVGDILVDSASTMAPNGYLRKISKIENGSGTTILRTEQAKLWEAIPQASIRYTSGVLNKKMLKSVELSEGVKFSEKPDLNKTNKTEFEVFSFDLNKDIGNVNVSGSSSLDMEFIFNFDWSFSLDLDLVEVDLFKTAININQSSNNKVQSNNGETLHEKVSIAKMNFTPWTFSLGPVPVVLVPQVELFIEVDGTISAQLSTWASENYSSEIGLKYTSDDGWEGIGTKNANLDFHPPVLKAGANFESHVGPEVKVLLYGVAGPTMNITGCCKLDAAPTTNGNWNLNFNIGAKAEAGVEVSLLGFDLSYDTELFCIKKNLFSLNDEPFGNSISIVNPVQNATLKFGEPVKIETQVVGDNPSKVEFYIDDNLQFTDTEKPFTYNWETSGSSLGKHSLEVKEIINDNEISNDKIEVTLSNASWQSINLSQFGVSEHAVISQVTFVDGNNGWIFVKSDDVTLDVKTGYVLVTHDGGNTWEKKFEGNYNSGFSEAVALNTEHLYGRTGNFVYQSMSGGNSFSTTQLQYCPGDPPPPADCNPNDTFPFDVEGIAMNNNGELVAVGTELHLSSGETDFIIRRARTTDNDPTGEFRTQNYFVQSGDFAKILFKNNFGIVYNAGTSNNKQPVVLISNDNGETWNDYPATFQSTVGRDTYAYDAFFWDENTGWIVGGTHYFSDGYIAKTTDGGKTFSKIKFSNIGIDIDGGASAGAVWFVSPEEGYVGFRHLLNSLSNDSYRMYHTTDGGATWTPVKEIVAHEGINDIFFLGQKFGWAVGNGNIIYKYTAE